MFWFFPFSSVFLRNLGSWSRGRSKTILRSLPGFIRCIVMGTGRAGQGGHVATPGPGRGRLRLPRGAPEARRPPRRHPVPRTNEKLLASCFGRRQVHTGKQEKRPEGVARIMFSKFHPAPHLALACYRTRIKGVCRFIFLCDLGSPGFLGPGQNPARPSSFV